MELYLAALLFALSASITPGPNNLMILSSGVNFGVKESIPHLLGICIGFPAMVIIIGLGLHVFFEQYPLFHQGIKLFGIVYLLYLAWRIASMSTSSVEQRTTKPFSFIQAALFQWVNPKAWLMATSAVATYTSQTDDLFIQVIFIAIMFFFVALPCVGVWLFFGLTLNRYLTSEKHRKRFNFFMALLLIISILPVLKESIV